MTWAEVFWEWRKERQRTLKLRCPACGERGCLVEYDAMQKKLKRICRTCSCLILQDTFFPDLFLKQ